jgi:hypothetical protein
VKVNKVIRKRIRRTAGGINFAGDVSAVVAGNVGERSSSSHVSVSSRQDIVQTTGRSKTQEDVREQGTD